MTKIEYMEALKSALKDFDNDIQEEIINDYEEHFAIGAANGKSEEEIAEELGSIDELVEELTSLQGNGAEKKSDKTFKSAEDIQKNFDDMLKGFAGFLGSMAASVSNNAGKFTEGFANEAESFAKEFAEGFDNVAGKVVNKSTEYAEKFVDKSKAFAEEVASSYKNNKTEEPKAEEVNEEVKAEEDIDPGFTIDPEVEFANTEANEEKSFSDGEYNENAKRVIIETDSADVVIDKAEDGKLDFEYVNDGTPNQQLAYKFDVKQEGDTVRVTCKKQLSKTSFFNFIPVPDITVTAHIPAGLDRLDVHVVSGDVTIDDVNLSTLAITTVSGNVDTNNTNAGNASISSMSGDINIDNTNSSVLSVKTVSGDVLFAGSVSNANAVTTSGDLEIKASGMKDLAVSTVSGDTSIELKNATGYRANIKSVSGDMGIRLGEEGSSYLRSGSYTLGDGSCNITVSSVSGDIDIVG